MLQYVFDPSQQSAVLLESHAAKKIGRSAPAEITECTECMTLIPCNDDENPLLLHAEIEKLHQKCKDLICTHQADKASWETLRAGITQKMEMVEQRREKEYKDFEKLLNDAAQNLKTNDAEFKQEMTLLKQELEKEQKIRTNKEHEYNELQIKYDLLLTASQGATSHYLCPSLGNHLAVIHNRPILSQEVPPVSVAEPICTTVTRTRRRNPNRTDSSEETTNSNKRKHENSDSDDEPPQKKSKPTDDSK